MTEIRKHISIPTNVSSSDELDYSFLRKKGLEYLEQFAGNLWTDYNSHDPGVTILEMLAYAITDLGARINMPIENLLAPEKKNERLRQFFKAEKILPTHPVTENDYRKLFIDIEGVKNCWLKPYQKTVYVNCKDKLLSYNPNDFKDLKINYKEDFTLQGLYRVLVDLEVENPTEQEKEEIYDKIRKQYHRNRNLCEDLTQIKAVDPHPIAICASIELYPEFEEEEVHAKVLRAIDNYLSPSLRFYSLKQMFDKGYTTDQIFEGPILQNGFIDPKELEKAGLRTEVRLSDLMNLIMDIEGVKVIKEITIKDCLVPEDEMNQWIICVKEGLKPTRCETSVFSYYKDVLPLNVNRNKVDQYLIQMASQDKEEQSFSLSEKKLEIPKGIFMNPHETTTIQNDFPETYGIGFRGLPSTASTARKSQAKQLKGYLLFFDQMLASYFAHLSKVKEILAVDSSLKQTYFTQAVKDIADFDELVNNYPKTDDHKLTELLFSAFDNSIQRKNKILDHLIARFAERFSNYTFLMKQLYGESSDKMVLKTKESFLKNYDSISKNRGSSFNYFRQPPSELWNTKNVTGVEKRIARLIGINDYSRRNLSDSFVEIYQLTDSKGEKVYRWRIRNKEGKIVLTATENYSSTRAAERELNLAIRKIREMSEEIIRQGFPKDTDGIALEVPDDVVIGNFQVQRSKTGKYSFNILDHDQPSSGSDWIIARHYIYYDKPERLEEKMLEFLQFIIEAFTEEGVLLTEEGMFLVEHILLRPDVTNESAPHDEFMAICDDDCNGCGPLDPYSYRVTVVLPGWTYRFWNTDFRNFLEDLIRKELPAHVLPRICWVGYRKNHPTKNENDMVQFENAFREFLLEKTNLVQKQHKPTLVKLIDKINKLNTIYHPGRLFDCDSKTNDLEDKIILGRTNLGNI